MQTNGTSHNYMVIIWWHIINHWSVLRRIDPFFWWVWNDVSPPSIEKVKTLKRCDLTFIGRFAQGHNLQKQNKASWESLYFICNLQEFRFSRTFPRPRKLFLNYWHSQSELSGALTGAASSLQAGANNRCAHVRSSVSYRSAVEPQSLCTFTMED